MKEPIWYNKVPWKELNAICDKLDIDADLAAAIIMAESGGDHLAVRFEPKWKLYVTPETFARKTSITYETERLFQACSWGVMQVMGAVARECGYVGHILQLTDMTLGLLYGCRKLKKCLERYTGEADAIAAYNAGTPMKTPAGKYTNQDYIDRVQGFLKDLDQI